MRFDIKKVSDLEDLAGIDDQDRLCIFAQLHPDIGVYIVYPNSVFRFRLFEDKVVLESIDQAEKLI